MTDLGKQLEAMMRKAIADEHARGWNDAITALRAALDALDRNPPRKDLQEPMDIGDQQNGIEQPSVKPARTGLGLNYRRP